MTIRVNNLLYGSILGLFLLGMWAPRRIKGGAFAGGLLSVATVVAYSLFTRYSWT